MKRSTIIDRTQSYVREKMLGEGSGHDWWHVYRVRTTALAIARQEAADQYIVELGALLHDIADYKFHDGDASIGPATAAVWLSGLDADAADIDHVCQIIRDISYKGAGHVSKMKTLEGEVVQDADRLDAIGAVGIARVFAYGGHKNRQIYDPGIAPTLHQSAEEYLKDEGASINHFYEKLLRLKDEMNTETGRVVAASRHQILLDYLEQFYAEWEGEDVAAALEAGRANRTEPDRTEPDRTESDRTERGPGIRDE